MDTWQEADLDGGKALAGGVGSGLDAVQENVLGGVTVVLGDVVICAPHRLASPVCRAAAAGSFICSMHSCSDATQMQHRCPGEYKHRRQGLSKLPQQLTPQCRLVYSVALRRLAQYLQHAC